MGIPIVYFRSSSFNGFRMCEQQAFSEYILGWRHPSGKAADKGTIVHKALEVCAIAKKALQDGEKYIEDEVVGRVETDNYDPKYLDNILDKCFEYYKEKTPHHNLKPHSKWVPKDLKECRKWMWEALTFKDGLFDPCKRDIVDAEPGFDFELEEDWAKYKYNYKGETIEGRLKLKGTIDLITDLGDGVYEIIDYKTGARKDWATGEVKTPRKLFIDPQLRIYHLAAKHLYPHVKTFLVTIYFLNDDNKEIEDNGGPFTMHFQDKDIEVTKEILKNKFEYLQKVESPQLNPPERWMCKSMCPFGKTTFEGTSVLPIIENRPRLPNFQKPMTKCEQIRYSIDKHGMDWVIENMSHEDHDCNFYKSPGEV